MLFIGSEKLFRNCWQNRRVTWCPDNAATYVDVYMLPMVHQRFLAQSLGLCPCTTLNTEHSLCSQTSVSVSHVNIPTQLNCLLENLPMPWHRLAVRQHIHCKITDSQIIETPSCTLTEIFCPPQLLTFHFVLLWLVHEVKHRHYIVGLPQHVQDLDMLTSSLVFPPSFHFKFLSPYTPSLVFTILFHLCLTQSHSLTMKTRPEPILQGTCACSCQNF